jgi:hypothetical protein
MTTTGAARGCIPIPEQRAKMTAGLPAEACDPRLMETVR